MDDNTQSPLTSPEPLRAEHDLSKFSSGENELDTWLRERASKNEKSGASRTYVICPTGTTEVVGYYSLATGAVDNRSAPGNVRRNMPDPIPVMVLGKLAITKEWQGRGLGNGLLQNAILLTLQASRIAGIRAILVHAISASAQKFYEDRGFKESPLQPMTLMMRLSDAEKTIFED